MAKSVVTERYSSSFPNFLLINTLALAEIMFDFEKLSVYTKAKNFNVKVNFFLKDSDGDRTTIYQLRRASLRIMLNIAEVSGRNSKADKRHFYVISRGSAFECVANFDFLSEIQVITDVICADFYHLLDEISRMLSAMIKRLS